MINNFKRMINKKFLKSITLVEILISITVIIIGIGAAINIYFPILQGIFLESSKMIAWELAKGTVELFINNRLNLSEGSHQISLIELEQQRILTQQERNNYSNYYNIVANISRIQPANNLFLIEVVVCFRDRDSGRIVGEDINLNGNLDSGEDIDGNRRISSPITITTVIRR